MFWDWLPSQKFTRSYELFRPYGSALLEGCVGDRGNWRLSFDFSFHNHSFIGMTKILSFISGVYYFDLDNAKSETENWLTLAESQPCVAGEQATLKNDLDELKEQSMVFGSTYLLPGRFCILSIREVVSPFPLFIVSPSIPPGVHLFLQVDDSDGFPRMYLDETVARKESLSWMRCRNQLMSERFVEAGEANQDPNGLFKHLLN